MGFNEAGARAPRIQGVGRVPRHQRAGFNEAGARAPRIPAISLSGFRFFSASMRPGRARPGYQQYRCQVSVFFPLQ